MARAAERRLGEFNAQELANTAWAFAAADWSDALLFWSLARAAEWRLDGFNAQNLGTMAWAFAKADWLDALLFCTLARTAERRLSEFNAQELANTAWALVCVCLWARGPTQAWVDLHSWKTSQWGNHQHCWKGSAGVDQFKLVLCLDQCR